jgi:serine protease
VPYSAPYLIATVNGTPMFQGGLYDNIYGVCASTTTQTGSVVDNGGVPTAASGNCSGRLNRYISYAGTSMAAPHVTGMAAVLYAKLGGAPTPAKRDRVEACIKTTADNIGSSSIFGSGRVNVKKALDAMTAGTC